MDADIYSNRRDPDDGACYVSVWTRLSNDACPLVYADDAFRLARRFAKLEKWHGFDLLYIAYLLSVTNYHLTYRRNEMIYVVDAIQATPRPLNDSDRRNVAETTYGRHRVRSRSLS